MASDFAAGWSVEEEAAVAAAAGKGAGTEELATLAARYRKSGSVLGSGCTLAVQRQCRS